MLLFQNEDTSFIRLQKAKKLERPSRIESISEIGILNVLVCEKQIMVGVDVAWCLEFLKRFEFQ